MIHKNNPQQSCHYLYWIKSNNTTYPSSNIGTELDMDLIQADSNGNNQQGYYIGLAYQWVNETKPYSMKYVKMRILLNMYEVTTL